MKQLDFSKNSWHWRLANYYGNAQAWYSRETDSYEYHGDICTYTRSVLLGVFAVAVLIGVMGIVAASVGNLVAWVASGVITGEWVLLDPIGVIIVALMLAVLCFAASMFAHSRYDQYRRNNTQSSKGHRPDSFASAVYRKVKSKTCFRVSVK